MRKLELEREGGREGRDSRHEWNMKYEYKMEKKEKN